MSQEGSKELSEEAREAASGRFEARFGLVLSILAAVLAVTDLGGGKYGGDELIAVNERASAYAWYSAKGVKETVTEGEAGVLEALLEAGVIAPEAEAGVTRHASSLREKAARYGRDKAEILRGSAAVGPEGWSQEIGGELGKVIGAEELDATVETLGAAGDWFDLSTLFLQLCLVMGAVGLLVDAERLKRTFFWLMIGLGAVGGACTAMAYSVVL